MPFGPVSEPYGLGAFDGDAVFSEFFAESPEFDALLPTGATAGDVPPSLSAEIESLLAAAAARVRDLPAGPAVPPTDEAVVSQAVIDELEELLARNTEERSELPQTTTTTTAGLEAFFPPVASEPSRELNASQPPPWSLGESAAGPRTLLDPRTDSFLDPARQLAHPASFQGAGLQSQRIVRDTILPENGPVSLGFTAGVEFGRSEPLPVTRAPGDLFIPDSIQREARPTLFDMQAKPSIRPPIAEREFTPFSGHPVEAIGRAIRGRASGALELSSIDGTRVRLIMLRDGDLIAVASAVEGEAMLDMLVARGELSADVVGDRAARMPRGGRHAAAALIAQGFLGQDDLWTVLRAHAEWTLTRALREETVQAKLLSEPPERLRVEPNVFGGAAGVEVFVELVRRTIGSDEAIARLGGTSGLLDEGPAPSLLYEGALDTHEVEVISRGVGGAILEVLERLEDGAALLYALVALDVLRVKSPGRNVSSASPQPDAILDATAIRERVLARLRLVHEADYFALLGLDRNATSYEIRRAYLELRRNFEPSRILTGDTADLNDDVQLILDVVTEAYEVLRDDTRRKRYGRALGATSK